jgi:hypothetical protein
MLRVFTPRQPRLRQASRLGLVLLAAALVPGSGWAEEAAWRGQWRTALALYKKKQFDAACPLFESVAQAQPKNAAVWGDLGLCELKRGTAESESASIHASRMAVRFGDERIRKAAYYNLGLASVKESLPDDACTTLSAPGEAQCPRSGVVCVKSWQTSGRVFRTSGSVALFARTQADAERQRDDFSELDPELDNLQSGVVLYRESENSCGTWCAANAWQGQDSSLVMRQAMACDQKQKGPLPGPPDLCVSGGKRCSDIIECVQSVLSHESDSPPIAREWGRMRQKCESECTAGADSSPSPTCSVVHVDACRGYVGVVCSEPNAKGGRPTLRALELELPDPEPSSG